MSLEKKFVFGKNKEEEIKHWNKCERYRIPFISVVDKNKTEVEVFYDITNITSSEKLENISHKVKRFYTLYLEFLHLEISSVQEYFDEYYFFRFKLKREFYESLVEKLYDFLLDEIKSSEV